MQADGCQSASRTNALEGGGHRFSALVRFIRAGEEVRSETHLYALEVTLLVVGIVRHHLRVGLLLLVLPRKAFHHTVETILDPTHRCGTGCSRTRTATSHAHQRPRSHCPGPPAAGLRRTAAAQQVTYDVTDPRCIRLKAATIGLTDI